MLFHYSTSLSGSGTRPSLECKLPTSSSLYTQRRTSETSGALSTKAVRPRSTKLGSEASHVAILSERPTLELGARELPLQAAFELTPSARSPDAWVLGGGARDRHLDDVFKTFLGVTISKHTCYLYK